MTIEKMKTLPYENIQALFKEYLFSLDITQSTVNTAYSDAFYLWRNGNSDQFWTVVESPEFDEIGMKALTKLLSSKSSGNAHKRASEYLSHLRRFRSFLASEGTIETEARLTTVEKKHSIPRKIKSLVDVPTPSNAQIEKYLELWDTLDNYRLQEDALDKLFFELSPQNTDIADILLKAATLNDFYSTNIFSIYPVAKHIIALNIDDRLKAGDVTLVGDIQRVYINGTEKNFYSFATKYCSHHNPLEYPIYDSHVDEVLCYFRNRDGFSDFRNSDLKDYVRFKSILIDFRSIYGLVQYNLKQIDKYLWQLGKDYFPKSYGKSNRGL